ncbi:hypothetical protein B4N89_08735 [Embleya scabrispora]|uniref:DUF2330 domain-containing protein n=1 Tax=Embleya scabrispora TaxID=159449 RepID=A0A1T3P7F7_9ACTN|nr:DUF2330 domain-containing protein [Embleya scabrispora]OPC84901.1 hypothetical protein B4N89_08735 [Embleya scabrispora]
MGMRGTWWDRVLRLLMAVVSIQVVMIAQPAWACGCGAAVPADGRTLSVGRETSVVRWDGRVERIDMRLSVSGDAERAAWIMPVPTRATLALGDDALFGELERVVAPVERVRHHFWPNSDDWPFGGGSDDRQSVRAAAPPAAGGVEVVGRERLGAFDVARLAATDPRALGSWLADNGFHLPDALASALEPYVRQRWEYVAIRLAPEVAAGGPTTLRGDLDPLRLSFASDRLVYPMRLSRLAKVPQHLRLYVLAAHRMQPRSDIGGAPPKVLYAGRPDLRAGDADVRAPIDGKPAFLTAIDQNFSTPSAIDDDHELRPTAHDTGYQRATYRDELLTVGGVPAWLLTAGGGLAVVAAAAGVWWRGRRRRGRGRGRAGAWPGSPPTMPPTPPRPLHAPH